MNLTQISLKNFRCFDQLTVDLNDSLTVLVSPNGQGKTAILDAIRIALWPYVSAFDVVSGSMSGSGIDIDDVLIRPTQVQPPLNMEAQLPCVIEASGVIGRQPIEWSRSRRKVSRGSKTTIKEAFALTKIGSTYQDRIRLRDEADSELSYSDLKLPVVAYYGTARLWKRRKLTLQRKSRSDIFSRTYAYLGCLDSASDYGSFLDWFFFNFAADFEQKTKTLERAGYSGLYDTGTSYEALLKAVTSSVDRVMEQWRWTGLRYSPTNQTLVMSHPEQGELKVDQLSDGLRNVIAMVGDIAYRCVRLNPQLRTQATLEAVGVVLIDEIDLHLHPQWQQVILASLKEAFPNIQFIVTTHSPQVLTSIRKEHIRTLGKDRDGRFVASIPLAASYGEESSDVLQSIMHVDPHPPIREKPDLKRLIELVDQGRYETPEAKNLLQALADALGREHPQLQRIQRSIKRQGVLKG